MKNYIRRKIARKIADRLADFYPSFSESKVKNPFFIIGCGRSGTSLLLKVLAAHLEIAAYPDEANKLWHPQAYPWHESKLFIPPFWSEPYGFTRMSLQNRTEKDDRKIQAIFAGYQAIAGGKCFLNKSVTISFMLPEVLKLFPTARFIHLVRDGRAVALSYAKKQLKKQAEFSEIYRARGYYLSLDALLESFARHWQEHILYIERYKSEINSTGNPQLLEIRYEDFCENPIPHLDRIAEFMEIDETVFLAKDYSTIQTQNYKYRAELAPEMIQLLEQLIEPGLKSQHYL